RGPARCRVEGAMKDLKKRRCVAVLAALMSGLYGCDERRVSEDAGHDAGGGTIDAGRDGGGDVDADTGADAGSDAGGGDVDSGADGGAHDGGGSDGGGGTVGDRKSTRLNSSHVKS